MDGVFHICKLLSFILSQSHNIVSQACAQKVFHYAFCMYTLSARFANVLMMQGIYHKPGTRPIWTGHTSNFLVHGEHARTCWMQTLGWNLWFSDMGTCPLSGVRNGTIFSWQKGLASVYPHCVCVYQWHICVAMYFTIVACSGKQKYTSKTTSGIFKIVSMMTCRCGPLPRVWLRSCFQFFAGPVHKFAQFRLTS